MQNPLPSPVIDILINEKSGSQKKEEEIKQILQLFKNKGVRIKLLRPPQGGDLSTLLDKAFKGDSDIIVAGGGDGTVNAVASVLTGTRKTLGVLPLGTLNHFAKDMSIPLDIEGAVDNIIAGNTTKVDVGSVNKHFFINNSSLGLYPRIVKDREQQQRLGAGKWQAFIGAAFKVLARYPLLNVRMQVDGQEIASRTPFVFIGNNEYKMNLFEIGSRESLSEDQLSLYMAPISHRSGLAILALKTLVGGLKGAKDFKAMKAKEIWIDAGQRKLRVAMDGETLEMDTPLHCLIHSKALRVIVPAIKPEKNA